MPTKDMITSADLADLRRSALGTANPLGVAADLADAVEQGRLAEPNDAGDALTLAAEIAEVRARLDAALRYADRAVAAYPSGDDARAGFARALRARILFRSGGREDEAMAELTALRPLLTEQPDAPAYVSAALDAGGRSATAEEWLSEAADTLLGQRATAAGGPAETASVTAGAAVEVGPPESPGVLFFLLQQRHRVRRNLNMPHDRTDDLADRLENQLLRRAQQQTGEPDLVFFPRPEFDRLLADQPALTETYGPDWDAHRARLEKELVRLAGTGRAGLHVLRGSVDGLTGHAGRQNGDPAEPQVRAGYARELEARPAWIPWPPERNDACWCGSGLKYKKCCLPRSRS
ncbi:SEC-C domain-containing protein [Micromonospora costi]|uniref:SEC-C domain-containing protein n=1 Tax=Micromonospora costi TaxID=1530042 RepID=UPI0033BFD2B7